MPETKCISGSFTLPFFIHKSSLLLIMMCTHNFFHTGLPKRNEGTAELSLQEKDSANNLGFLKDLNVELQEIKKQLAQERHHIAPNAVKQQDKSFLLLERVLIYSRLLLSIIFLIFICVKWMQ